NIPVMGITKPEVIPANAAELVYITPTFADVASLADCCEIIALDATLRPRPNSETLAQIVQQSRKQFPKLLLMADVATIEEGINAAQLGFDLISTTLSGYTTETQENSSKKQGKPDFELLAALTKQVQTPIVMEGRIWEPAEVQKAFALGAFCV